MGYSRTEKGQKLTNASSRLPPGGFAIQGLAGIGHRRPYEGSRSNRGAASTTHLQFRATILVAEAVGSAFGTWKRQLDAAATDGPPAIPQQKLIDDYLNEVHRDNPGFRLCFPAALAPEIARTR